LSGLPEYELRQRRNLDQRSKYNQSLGWSIEQRPSVIKQRNRIGDFEMDTVVGPRGHSNAVLLTLLDCKSRFLWAYRLKDQTAATVNEALTDVLTTFKGPVNSLTVTAALNLAVWFHLNHSTVFRSITVMLMHQLNAVVMHALIGTYVIFTLKGLVLSTLVHKIWQLRYSKLTKDR
jgi:IS30 family transposase